jgi:hypothetical protein
MAGDGVSSAEVRSAAMVADTQQARAMKISIDLDGTSVTTTLDDNATSRDFVALLPLTLMLEDYNHTEKISDLSKKLSTQGAPEGVEPAAGDIAYYAPWGNLAIFYQGFRYSSGLVRLGRLGARVDAFRRAGTLRVTIRRVDD